MTKTPTKTAAKRAPRRAKTSPPVAAENEAAAATPAAVKPEGPRGKVGDLVALLSRPEGATSAEMMAATGWQAHSVRGALSGAIKRKLGLPLTSTKTETGRTYRIEAAHDAG